MTYTSDIFSGFDVSNMRNGGRLLQTYEMWFERYPQYAKASLRQRLGNGDNALGAWFELLLHELLFQLGCKVDVIDIDNTEKTPDFSVSHGGRKCYVEVTTVNPGDNPSNVDRNLEDALYKLNTLNSSDFQIRLIVEGTISRTLSKKELINTFGNLLSDNDPGMVQERIQTMGEWAAPYAEFKGEDWCLRGELLPKSSDKRSRGLIIGPMGSFAGDASPEVQKAVSKKAGKYDPCYAPLVVAANVLDIRFDREGEIAALFGQEQIQYFPGLPEVQDRLIRKPDGVWIKRGYEPRYTRLMGVIMFNGFFPWNPRGSVCLYLNPFVDNIDLPEPLCSLPRTNVENGYIRRMEGADWDYFLFGNSV